MKTIRGGRKYGEPWKPDATNLSSAMYERRI